MKLVFWGAAFFAAYLVVMMMALGAAVGNGEAPTITGPNAVPGIPPDYLALYVQAADQNKIDWAILAAVGAIETDHGRSKAQGVHSGVNAYGCCAGPMQFSVVGHPSTWDKYGKGGDVYDPRDAIPAAARYLVASGAPRDYHRAILAYNHSEQYYRDVMAKAGEYRSHAALEPIGGSLQGSPKQIIDTVVLPLANSVGIKRTVSQNDAANAAHGPTHSGGLSDHQGPPDQRWAADISNGVTTPQEDRLAAALAEKFGIPWTGSGLVSSTHGGYRFQLIYRAADHYDHVHFGVARVAGPPTP